MVFDFVVRSVLVMLASVTFGVTICLGAVNAPAEAASGSPDKEHAAVRKVIIEAMNDFVTAPAALLSLLEDDADWCDPFPTCVHGKNNISTFLYSMPEGTDTVLLAESMVTVGTVGGMMSTLSFSWPGADASCLYTADQHISWNLSSSSTVAVPKLQYVRWVYNASEFDEAIGTCLGPSAAARTSRWRRTHIQGGGREADLEAVKEYVVSLQYNLSAQALICDLLVPTARYCDPYPVRCAVGRKGCREMKGLPPDGDDPIEREHSPSTTQCRPGSVGPLLPTGAITGAMYMAYSSATRSQIGGRHLLTHKLHHTYAIFELAPPNSTQHAPAPLLASFDWFMPDHNV